MVTKNRLVIGVVGNDIHIVGNRIIHIALEEKGFNVLNIGINNPLTSFIQAAMEFNANAILVSSINGEAESVCCDFRKKVSQHIHQPIKLYIGGNLVVGYRQAEAVESHFLSWGFDRVFHQIDIHKAIVLIQKDLCLEGLALV